MHMKSVAWFVLAVMIILPAGASAKDQDVFAPPSGFSIQAKSYPPPPGEPAEYGASEAGPNWKIAQWGVPRAKLSPFTVVHQGNETIFTSVSPGASVVVTRVQDGAETYTLSQNGAVLPCETAQGNPREFDLFASPVNHSPMPGGRDAYHIADNTISLTAMSHLRAMATVSMKYETIATPKTCGVSQGGALIAVVLNNLIAHQTLFYHLWTALPLQVEFEQVCAISCKHLSGVIRL